MGILLSQVSLRNTANKANDIGVIRKLYNRVLSMSGIAVVGVHCEQEGAEHAGLGGSDVEH